MKSKTTFFTVVPILFILFFLAINEKSNAQKLYTYDYDTVQSQLNQASVSSYALDPSNEFLSILFIDNNLATTDTKGNVLWTKQLQNVDSDFVMGGDDTLFYHYLPNYSRSNVTWSDKSTSLILEQKLYMYTYPSGIKTLKSSNSALTTCQLDSLGNVHSSFCYYDSIDVFGGYNSCKSNDEFYFDFGLYSSIGNWQTAIAKASKDGTLQWIKLLPNYYKTLFLTFNNNYLFVISKDSLQNVLLLKIDSAGKLINSTKIDNSANVEPTSIAALNVGSIGFSFTFYNNKKYCGVMLFDTALQILSTKTIMLDDNYEDKPLLFQYMNGFVYAFENHKPTVSFGGVANFDTIYNLALNINSSGFLSNSKFVLKYVNSQINNSYTGHFSYFVFGQGNYLARHYGLNQTLMPGIYYSNYEYFNLDSNFNSCSTYSTPITLKDSVLIFNNINYPITLTTYNLKSTNRSLTVNNWNDKFKMLCNANVSIEEETNQVFKNMIYPNPVTDFIYLNLEETGPVKAIIFDCTGRIISNKIYLKIAPIDVRSLYIGIYCLQISTPKKIMTQKFVKQ